jgi:hypothetical protein
MTATCVQVTALSHDAAPTSPTPTSSVYDTFYETFSEHSAVDTSLTEEEGLYEGSFYTMYFSDDHHLVRPQMLNGNVLTL